MKKLLLIALFLVITGSLTIYGCSSKTTPATSANTPAASSSVQSALPPTAWKVTPAGQLGGDFIWASSLGITNMGSHIDANSASITYPIFEPLLRTDEAGNLFGWLAQTWEISPDKKSITFKLRQGVKFHDGTTFNAEAVKYNLEQTAASNVAGAFVLKKISSYEVVDPYTLKLNLSAFDQTLLFRLAQTVIGQISSPTAMQTKTTPEERAVGTGPFKFQSWKRDDFVKAVKFPDYWQKGKPYLDSITYRTITDPTTMMMAFKSGEVHIIAPIEPVDVLTLRKEGFDAGPQGLSWVHSIIPDGNNADSPFADKRVRKALEYAIDRKGFVEGIGMGIYKVTYQMAIPENAWYDSSLPAYEYNVAKAKQLLAEAGYPNGFKTALVTDVRGRKDIITAVVTYLKDVGITTEVDVATLPRITELQQKGWKGILYPGFPHPINLVNYVARWGDPGNYVSFYHPAGWNANLEAIYSETDSAKTASMLKATVKTIYDESIAIPLADTYSLYARNKDQVYNYWFHSNATSGWWEAADVWMKKK
jgi:peptide/nickel transport system substrate-binding protein